MKTGKTGKMQGKPGKEFTEITIEIGRDILYDKGRYRYGPVRFFSPRSTNKN